MPIHGHFLWHELMTSDPDAARLFYRKVVGWQPAAWNDDPSYTLLMCGKAPMGGLMAIPPDAKAQGVPPHWMTYVGTADADATSKEAQRLGGKVLHEPWEVPGAGRMAILEDPQGVAFAVISPANMPTLTYPVAIGDFSWHELVTTDLQAAFDFYQRMFGWQKTGEHDMGPMGLYLEFGLEGVTFGGIFKKPADMPAPPHWLVYAKVYDSTRVAATAKRAGGTVVNGPMEVPGGDWIAQIVDPQGAAFAVHSATPAPVKKTGPAKKKAGKAKAAPKTKAKAASKAKAAPKAKAARPAARVTKRKAAKKAAKPRTVKAARKNVRKAVRKAGKKTSTRRK